MIAKHLCALESKKNNAFLQVFSNPSYPRNAYFHDSDHRRTNYPLSTCISSGHINKNLRYGISESGIMHKRYMNVYTIIHQPSKTTMFIPFKFEHTILVSCFNIQIWDVYPSTSTC
jgi:hypothetical protein